MYFFPQHTPRGSLEHMMRAVPRPTFRLGSGPGAQSPRGLGKPSCQDCVSYRRGEGCLLAACPYLADRLAAVYLLSARKALWARVRSPLSPWNIRWDSTTLGSLDPQSYALYRAAKGIWNGGLDIHPLELEDPDLIHDDTLLLIANAVLLARYGRAMLEAERTSGAS